MSLLVAAGLGGAAPPGQAAGDLATGAPPDPAAPEALPVAGALPAPSPVSRVAALRAAGLPGLGEASSSDCPPACPAWAATYDHAVGGFDAARDAAFTPDGALAVVMANARGDGGSAADIALLAYRVGDGGEAWRAVVDLGRTEAAWDLEVGAGAAYVAGFAGDDDPDAADALLHAYRLSDGSLAWQDRYAGPDELADGWVALALSPDGATLFALGDATRRGAGAPHRDVLLAAFDAATGERRWLRTWGGEGDERSVAIAVASDGATVFVSGSKPLEGHENFIAAFDATGGRLRWSADVGRGQALLASGPGDGRLYAAGTTGAPRACSVAAYDAATGAVAWSVRHAPRGLETYCFRLALGGDGVYAAGFATDAAEVAELAVLAFDRATGALRWDARRALDLAGLPRGLAVSPDGASVAVAGYEVGRERYGWVTTSHDAATGAVRWSRDFDDAGLGQDEPAALAMAPGGQVVVAGFSYVGATGWDATTVLHDGDTGAERWTRRAALSSAPAHAYAVDAAVSPGGHRLYEVAQVDGAFLYGSLLAAREGADGRLAWSAWVPGFAAAVAVDPAGRRVAVAGERQADVFSDHDYFTDVYDAATGARLWTAREDGRLNDTDSAWDVAFGPDGAAVYVTGTAANADMDYRTVAYEAATGRRLWASEWDGAAGEFSGENGGRALAVAPDGRTVFVTGATAAWAPRFNRLDYGTLALDAATGAMLWNASYHGGTLAPAGEGWGEDLPWAIAVAPDGSALVVAGESHGPGGSMDYATVAYDAAGALRWSGRFDGLAGADAARAVAFDAAGRTVFVTGGSAGTAFQEAVTLAYDAATGERRWEARLGDAAAGAAAWALAPSPTGAGVHVAGAVGAAGFVGSYDAGTGQLRVARRFLPEGMAAASLNGLHAAADGRLTATGSAADAAGLSDLLALQFEPNKPPVAAGSADRTEADRLTAVQFRDGSRDVDGRIVGWRWDFGDGAASNEQHPRHTFARLGRFQVSLAVTDDAGDTASVPVASVTVANLPPSPAFAAEPDPANRVDATRFRDLSGDPDGRVVAWAWVFGDGATSREREPGHRYEKLGRHEVTLTATDDDGAARATRRVLDVVNLPPEASFTVDPRYPTVLLPTRFQGTAADRDGTIAAWRWDFGDGGTSTEEDPMHVYLRGGWHDVVLTVTDNDGGTTQVAQRVFVCTPGLGQSTVVGPERVRVAWEACVRAGLP